MIALILFVVSRHVHIAQEGVLQLQILLDITVHAVPEAFPGHLADNITQNAHADIGVDKGIGFIL